MKSIVIYDSMFGNTKLVAREIAEALQAEVVSVNEISHNDLSKYQLVIIGSPIVGWKPSEKMGQFLATLKRNDLKGVKVATFDTRVKFFHGDAMKKIAVALRKSGGEVVIRSAPFYVMGKEGPLFEGEIEKSKQWASEIKDNLE